MRRAAGIVTAVFVLLGVGATSANGTTESVASSAPCSAGTSPQTGTHWLRCETQVEESSIVTGLLPSALESSASTNVRYSYVWLPNCPGALPSDQNVGDLDCQAAHSCADAQLMSMSLYAMQLTNASGQHINSGWSYLGSECRNPSDAGPTKQPRVLTWTDVLSAIKQVGVPGASVQGPAYTLVNLDTTFYTQAAPFDRPLTIIGYNVVVDVQPATYTWHWGDGASETTNTPGHPYPSTDVTHTYIHATDANVPVQLSVDVTYTARYRVNGGVWQDIPETLTIPGPPKNLPIKQASAVLVAGN